MAFPSLSPRAIALALVCLSACRGPDNRTAGTTIVIDGVFDEWPALATILSDPVDAPAGAAVDLGVVQALSDGRFLYLTIETGNVVNAQAMPGTVYVLLDADGDRRTGIRRADLDGVDLVLELSRQDAPDAAPLNRPPPGDPNGGATATYGAGMAAWTPDSAGTRGAPVDIYELGLIVAPTHAADRFEIRLRRGVRGIRGLLLLGGDRARTQIVYEAAGDTVDRTDVAEIDLTPLNGDPLDLAASPARWTESIAPSDDVVRVVVWNVASEGFRDRPERFARIVGGLEPDVLLLDELFGEVRAEDLEAFFGMEPLRALGRWDFVLGGSGGRQKALVASRLGVRVEPTMQDLHYPPASLTDLAEAFPDPRAQRQFEYESAAGMSSVGVWVDVSGLPTLFVPLDLQSTGHTGSFEDELRKLQAGLIRDRAAQALGGATQPAAVVLAGDLNLVGSVDPLTILVRGLDQGGADLAPADARRLTDASYATWRSPRTPFTPGRLDFVLVPERALEVRRAFAFDAAELSDELRSRLGIAADDPTMTSDHLPIVVDLARRR